MSPKIKAMMKGPMRLTNPTLLALDKVQPRYPACDRKPIQGVTALAAPPGGELLTRHGRRP